MLDDPTAILHEQSSNNQSDDRPTPQNKSSVFSLQCTSSYIKSLDSVIQK